MKLFQIEERNIEDIIIEDRARTDFGDIESLASNIELIGQTTPIIIDSSNKLIDGHRRIQAFQHLKRDTIEVRVADGVTKDDKFLIELFSNRDRKEFIWHEEILLKAKLHNYWKEQAEAKNKTWGFRETAKQLDCSLGGLSTDLTLAEALKVFPMLKEHSTKGRAREAYKSMGQQAAALQRLNNLSDDEKANLKKLQEGIVDIKPKEVLKQEDKDKTKEASDKVSSLKAEEEQKVDKQITVTYVAENYKTFIDKLPDNSIGMVELDPPYAIDFENTYGKTSKIESKATDWTEKQLYEFYYNYLSLIYQKMFDASWILCWTGKEHYLEINKIAKETGFAIQQPGAWIKPGGSTNQPKKNLISNWEMFLLFRKGEAQFNTPSLPSAVQVATNSASKRIHQWEKPIELYDHFLKALCKPGTLFLSPFAGSGNCLISAAKHHMIPYGCDKTAKYIPQFYENLHNYLGLKANVRGL